MHESFDFYLLTNDYADDQCKKNHVTLLKKNDAGMFRYYY